MIEKVKDHIYRHERKQPEKKLPFMTLFMPLYMIVGLKAILLSIVWLILSTQGEFCCQLSICYCHLVHVLLFGADSSSSLCRSYSQQWLSEVPNRVAPHEDVEVSDMRNKCFRKMFPNPEDLRTIKRQFANFSLFGAVFVDSESIEDQAPFLPKQ